MSGGSLWCIGFPRNKTPYFPWSIGCFIGILTSFFMKETQQNWVEFHPQQIPLNNHRGLFFSVLNIWVDYIQAILWDLFKTLGVAPSQDASDHRVIRIMKPFLAATITGRPQPIHSWSFREGGLLNLANTKMRKECLEGWLNPWIYLVYAYYIYIYK